MMKAVYSAIGLAVAGVANATPCTDQQITALGLAFLQATSCDDVKAISAPDCTDDGDAASQTVTMMGGLCDQLGFDDWQDQVLSGGGGNASGSGGLSGGPGTPCTDQQTEAFALAYAQATTCDDIKAITGPDCTEEGQDLSTAPASMGLMCDQMGFDDFKAYFDQLVAQGGGGAGGSGGFGPQGGSGSGSGSGSDSSEDCVGDDCCTPEQEMDFVKEAMKIQKCDDLDNVKFPTCKVSNSQVGDGKPAKEFVKLSCTSQGVDVFKAALKEQEEELEEELEKKLKDKDPSGAFGVKPLTLVAPLLALYFVL